MKTTVTAAASLLLVCLLALSSQAQQSATATLSGIITDQNGAFIIGVQITATQKATGVQRETTQHQANHGDLNHRFTRLSQVFVIFAQSATTT